jgi:opacity protein-like surface antigen
MRHTSNIITKALCGGFIFALVAAAPLKGQEIRWGAQVSIVNPTGDLSNMAKMGFGAAFLGEYALNDKMALRGKFDYLMFGEKKETELESEYKWSNSIYSVTADYIYRLDSHENGLYGVADLGFFNCSTKYTITETNYWGGVSDSWSTSNSESGFGYSIGVGYNFNSNLGAEAKIVSFSSDFITYQWIQASCNYRF